LPSSLTRVISIALVFSTRPPVSVLVRARATSLEAFLGGMASRTCGLRPRHHVSELCPADFPTGPPTRLPQDDHRLGSSSLPRPPVGQTVATRYWNINQLSIAYACRPRLRSRLTLSRIALLRNPWAFGGRVSHTSLVTHASILTSQASTAGFRRRFVALGTLPYHRGKPRSTASVRVLSPVTSSAHEHLTSELLRTLSRVAASKPTSWLLTHPHIVSHLDSI
jgi:hypothetical protein